jgi:hypothetical protein
MQPKGFRLPVSDKRLFSQWGHDWEASSNGVSLCRRTGQGGDFWQPIADEDGKWLDNAGNYLQTMNFKL